jgi:hypothetical protein
MIFVWNSVVADKHNESMLESTPTEVQKGMKVFVQYVRFLIHNFNQNS